MGKGQKISYRYGWKITALLGSPLEMWELREVIAAAIESSPLRATGEWIDDRHYKITPAGLVGHFDLSQTPERSFQIVLYSTVEIHEHELRKRIEQEVSELLLLITGVYQVRETRMEKCVWSEDFDDQLYLIDLPFFDVSVPADLEFSDEFPDSDSHEFSDSTEYFIDPTVTERDWLPRPPLSDEHARKLKREANRKAVWKHNHPPHGTNPSK